MLSTLKWDSLQERRQQNRLHMLYKIKHGLVDINPADYMRHADPRTRGSQRLYRERADHPALFHSFFPKTLSVWNALPEMATLAPTLEIFKARLAGVAPGVPVVDLMA